MSDLHDVLDRKARRFRPDEDGYERLVDRAERRHRNRRITSGVVALAVAVAGSLGAYAMLTAGTRTDLGSTTYRGIWPQTSLQEAQIAQARANQGDPRLTHQQEAFEFVHTFARDALWWVNVRVDPIPDAEAAGSGPLTATISGCTEEQLNTETDVRFCPPETMQTAEVTIERLVQRDPKGIWIVTAATVDGVQPSMEPSPMPPVETSQPGEGDAGEHPAVREFVAAFIKARSEGPPQADGYLADEAAASYASNEGGLQLYGYGGENGESWTIVDITVRPDTDRWDVVIRIEGRGGDFPESGTIHEQLVVGSPGDGAPLKVLTAIRNE